MQCVVAIYKSFLCYQSLPQTPLMWEPPALGLPPFFLLLTDMQPYSVNIELEDRLYKPFGWQTTYTYYHFSEWYFYHFNPQLQLMQLAGLCSFAQLFSRGSYPGITFG